MSDPACSAGAALARRLRQYGERRCWSGWLEAGVDPAHVSVIRPSGRPVGAWCPRHSPTFPRTRCRPSSCLAMKPYQLDLVAPALAPILDPETLLVSILAGVELASLRGRFPAPRTIVKAMPNLPVAARQGRGRPLQRQRGQVARALVIGPDGGARPCRMVRRRAGAFSSPACSPAPARPSCSASSRRWPRRPKPSASTPSRPGGWRAAMVEGAAAMARASRRRAAAAGAEGGEPRRHHPGRPAGAR